MALTLFNSLTRKKEVFKAINPPKVGVYTCGPTVYDYVTIGNWRTYVLGDLLIRTLKYFGFNPFCVMNITDVGHLTGDNMGDASIGLDRNEESARKQQKTVWEIADFYINNFIADSEKLNLLKPQQLPRATDHIKEQISLIEQIEKRGYVYKISDGIYFNVQAYEKAGFCYGKLSSLDKNIAGARVKINPEKKDPRDFALWKFSPKNSKRQMEWESPWGKGFPGWHIECSAMSMKYLGEQFDIHIGGEDLKSTHHPNEIAQSESATQKRPFVRYWLHGAFLLVDGKRMGKSVGNAYTIADLQKKGFQPLSLRYFYLTGHYRKQLNFTFEALRAAEQALNKLYHHVAELKRTREEQNYSQEKVSLSEQLRYEFDTALADDLNFPQVLEVVWRAVKSKLPDFEKLELLRDWDQILGLGLEKRAAGVEAVKPSPQLQQLINQRKEYRKKGNYEEADKIRKQIEAHGYLVKDTEKGSILCLNKNV